MYKRILYPIDLQHIQESRQALNVAITEAQRSNAEILVMTVTAGFGMPIVASFFDEKTVNEAMKEVARHLKAYVDDNFPDNIATRALVVEGNPAELILEQAKKENIDLIVIASHNNQIEHLLLGSCAAKVVRHSECSVIVVK